MTLLITYGSFNGHCTTIVVISVLLISLNIPWRTCYHELDPTKDKLIGVLITMIKLVKEFTYWLARKLYLARAVWRWTSYYGARSTLLKSGGSILDLCCILLVQLALIPYTQKLALTTKHRPRHRVPSNRSDIDHKKIYVGTWSPIAKKGVCGRGLAAQWF